MFCRAKTSVLLALVGALSASGAALDAGRRNTAFQPDRGSSFSGPAVWRPAETVVSTKLWPGAKVQKIAPGAHTVARVEMRGVAFTKARDPAVTSGPVKPAGGSR
jgi:hypothetical protein